MIRRSQLNVTYANANKLRTLDSVFEESKRVVNLFIDFLWSVKDFKSKFVTNKVDTWLSARMQQCLGKQALEIVKSQRKRKKKTKPQFNRDVINFDSRFVDIEFDSNSFDVWVRIKSIGNKISVNLPSRKHKHFNSYNEWSIKKSARLRRSGGKYFIDLYFEKDAPDIKEKGGEVGLDCGYKKLLVSSDGKIHDSGMVGVYEKISRKKQGSKRFKKSLSERDNLINQSINTIDLSGVKTIVVEDLVDVKKNSSGKIKKEFNNKLQRWSYSKVLSRLELLCEEKGVRFIKVNPAYTSQTCSKCGHRHKNNRSGENFKCLCCNYSTDADFNASVNILRRGVYSPSATN